MDLTNNDYKIILNYYQIPFHNMKPKKIKDTAEAILADKLCRCIKKVTPENGDETKAIGICKNSVIKKKGLTSAKFKCKKKPVLISYKNSTKKLKKLNKTLSIKGKTKVLKKTAKRSSKKTKKKK